MMYITIDAMRSGTGIRDIVNGGYLKPEGLGLSSALINTLKLWLVDYQIVRDRGFTNKEVNELDRAGMKIATKISKELNGVKIEYFSDAAMKRSMLR